MDKEVVKFLKQKNIRVIEEDEDIDRKLKVWRAWYRGKVDTFHNYSVYQGLKKIKLERKSLGMAARACQRWADLLLNEKVEINIDHEYTDETARRLLRSVNFYVRGNNLIETAFAVGGGFLIQYWNGKKTAQKYISQEYMYPITYDSGRLTEAAFSSKKYINGKQYVYLETHLLDENGEYVIDNALLCSTENGLAEVNDEFYKQHELIPKFETHSQTPLFQMIRPNVANRDNFDSPYGTSVFAGAIDNLKVLDVVYDSYYKEFVLGKKRIFVGDGVTNYNFDPETGEQVQVFDPQDEVFYHLPGDTEENGIVESNPELRVSEHDQALQTQLNCLSQSVGMGEGAFKWESGGAKTAHEIVSENSVLFRTLKKHEELLSAAIIDMVRGLLHIEATFAGNKKLKLDAEITVNFDDSIIEDTAEIKRQAMLEYNAGLIDDVEYYCTVYKMTEEQAKEYRKRIRERAEQPAEEPEPEGDDT